MSFITSRKHASARTHTAALTALAAGIAFGLPALAANAADADSGAAMAAATELPVINVKGQRIPYKVDAVATPKVTQSILDTPQTIDVIDKQVIAQQAATTLTDALRNSPGVGTFFVGENGSTATGDAVFMRGFDASGSIYVDGVRDLGAISRDVFDTEQVEVVKGPDGTLFGRTTPTGAINMVSKQPLLDNRASATLAWGSWDQKRATADLNTKLGEHSAFRLNVMDQDSGVPGRHEVQNDRWGIAPSLAFGLGTPTRVHLDFLHASQDNVPDGGVPTIGLPGYSSPDPTRPFLSSAPKVDPANFYGTDADFDHVKADMATLIVDHDFSDAITLHDTLRWGRTHENYLLTAFSGSAANLLTPDPLDPATWTIARTYPTFKDQTNRILTNQTNLTINFSTGKIRHNLSTGVELTREDLATGGFGKLANSAWNAANLYRPDPDSAMGLVIGDTGTSSHGRTDTAGIYAFDTLHFGERWLLTAGGRLDHYRSDFTSVVACGGRSTPACGALPTGTPVPGLDASIGGTLSSYKVGLVFKPTAASSLYADIATAHEPPGGNSLAFSATANNPDNPAFAPQSSRTLEIGSKWEVFDARLRLSAALYRTDVGNLVAQDPVDLQYYQIGRERVQGLELGAVGALTPHWAISAGYTVMNSHASGGIVSSSTTSSAPANDGSGALAYAPKSSFTAWSTWQLPRHVTLGAGARYSGAMQRGHDGAIGTPEYTEAYWVFDAMASYAINRHAALQLNVYNLFDKDYVAAINKSGYRYTPGQPRSAMLTLTLNY